MAEAPGTHNPSFLPPDIPVPQEIRRKGGDAAATFAAEVRRMTRPAGAA